MGTDLKIEKPDSDINETPANDQDNVDDLFEKYNLQISAVPKPDLAQADFTEFVGTAHNPHYKKKLDPKKSQQNQGKKLPETKQVNSKPKRGQKGKKKKMEKYA